MTISYATHISPLFTLTCRGNIDMLRRRNQYFPGDWGAFRKDCSSLTLLPFSSLGGAWHDYSASVYHSGVFISYYLCIPRSVQLSHHLPFSPSGWSFNLTIVVTVMTTGSNNNHLASFATELSIVMHSHPESAWSYGHPGTDTPSSCDSKSTISMHINDAMPTQDRPPAKMSLFVESNHRLRELRTLLERNRSK